MPEANPKVQKLKFTVRVRRGFNTVMDLIRNATDPARPPAQTTIDKLKADEKQSLTMALAWIDQNRDRE